MNKKLPLFIFLISCTHLFSQDQHPELNEYIEKIIEHVVSNTDGEVPTEILIEELENLYHNPLDLNTVSKERLEGLWILNDFQVKALLDYRQSMGQFISVHEIQYIYGFNKIEYEFILPFVKVESPVYNDTIVSSEIVRQGHYEYLARMSYKIPNSPDNNGMPVGMYTKLSAGYHDRIKLGILAENDSGEDFFGGINRYGFDFYSGYLQLKTNTFKKSITIGDYRLRAGQGILLWNGFSCGKSPEILSAIKRGQGLSVNTSKNEHNYLRGAGFHLGYNQFSLYVFGSLKKTDAIIDTINGISGIKSLGTSGYHISATECRRKHNCSEKTGGMLLQYKDDHCQIGINLLSITYSQPFITEPGDLKMNNFSGYNYPGSSVDYKILLNKYQFFGELAYGNNTFASLNGVNILLCDNFSANMIYRNYPPDYYSPYSNAFGENSNNSNETGLYMGLQWQASQKIRLSAYTDIFSFPWLSYNSDMPSNGNENMIEVIYSPNPQIRLNFRYKYKEKEKNITDSFQSTHKIASFARQNMRFHFSAGLSPKLHMNSRFECCKAGYRELKQSFGYLLYHDFSFQMYKHVKLTCRYAFYDIKDYNTRIYAYEHDVLYGFSMPAYYGNGQKLYLLFRSNLGQKVSLWLRYDFTHPFEENSNLIQNIKCQFRVKF